MWRLVGGKRHFMCTRSASLNCLRHDVKTCGWKKDISFYVHTLSFTEVEWIVVLPYLVHVALKWKYIIACFFWVSRHNQRTPAVIDTAACKGNDACYFNTSRSPWRWSGLVLVGMFSLAETKHTWHPRQMSLLRFFFISRIRLCVTVVRIADMQMIKEGQFVFLFIRIRPAYIQRKLPEFIAKWCKHANGEHRLFILFYVLKKIRVAFTKCTHNLLDVYCRTVISHTMLVWRHVIWLFTCQRRCVLALAVCVHFDITSGPHDGHVMPIIPRLSTQTIQALHKRVYTFRNNYKWEIWKLTVQFSALL